MPSNAYADPAKIIKEVAHIVKPPRRMSVTQCAEDYRVLNIPGGYSGPYRVNVTPYMQDPQNDLASREYTEMVLVGPAQCGKTAALLLNWFCYNVVISPSDYMIVQATENRAEDFSRKDISRLLRFSAEVKSQQTGSANDDNMYEKVFKAGNIVSIAWPTVSHLAGKSIPRVALTDYDRMPSDIGGDGEPFDLARKRTETFDTLAMCLAESSPSGTVDPDWHPSSPHEAPPVPGILSLYNRGDRRRYYVKCPHCGDYFIPDFNTFHWVNRDPKTTHLQCPHTHCHGLIDPSQKTAVTASGVWLAEGQQIDSHGVISGEKTRPGNIASFLIPCGVAAFQTWKSIVKKYLDAYEHFEKTGNQDALKTTTNVDQGDAYRPKRLGDDSTAESLQNRKQNSLMQGIVPHDCRFLTTSIDVQKNSFVVQVHGWGPNLTSWIIDRYTIDGIDPATYQRDWENLYDVFDKTYPTADNSRLMGSIITTCDANGRPGVTDRAYNFWRSAALQGYKRRFILTQGHSNPNKPNIEIIYPDNGKRKNRSGKITADARGQIPVLHINTTLVKNTVSANLRIESMGPGYVNIPGWLPESWFSEMTAEYYDDNKGRWVKSSQKAANEAFDLCAYNYASILHIKAHLIDWDNPQPSWAQSGNPTNIVRKRRRKKNTIPH